jgi:transcriptional regulator with XRE-family HTH domain
MNPTASPTVIETPQSSGAEAPPALTLRQPPARPSEVFAEQMRIQRERKGWTQKQLAARLGKLGYVVHQTTIGKWEAGERRMSLDEALVISVALDVSPAYMMAGSYLDGTFAGPGIALSAKTPPVSARKMRMWLRGQQPLWGQDEKRYHTEVAPDEWLAMQRAGVMELLRGVQDLVVAWADGDRETALELVEAISDELERQRRALEREMSKQRRRAVGAG